MAAISEVQDPQQRHLVVACFPLAAHRGIETAPAKLRLAFLVAATVDSIPFDDVDDAPQHRERMGEALGAQQGEIIGRTVVFRVLAVGRPHQATDRQIETGRAILPLVVAIGDERRDAVWHLIVMEYVGDDVIDRGVPSPPLFISYATWIAKAGKHETMSDAPDLILVAGEPGERPDRAGDEQKAITMARRKRLDVSRKHRRHRDA